MSIKIGIFCIYAGYLAMVSLPPADMKYDRTFQAEKEKIASKCGRGTAQNRQKNAVEDNNGSSPPHTEEQGTDYREEAARAVYDAVLAEEGFSYEVCYNAKGNLYIALGTKEEDGTTYSYSLVYDRPSKNGACELLVLYRSADGGESRAIVDMYAVETATGKVVASGRKTWSDVGTAEYREMTGE